MAPMTLIWTALPAGIRLKGNTWRARISIALAPRLEVSQGSELPLSSFPEFADWPRTLRNGSSEGIGFLLQVRDGTRDLTETTLRPLATGKAEDSPDSDAWRNIFSEKTIVRPFELPDSVHKETRLQTYPAGEVIASVRKAYGDMLSYELLQTSEPPALSEFTLKPDSRKTSQGQIAIRKFLKFHHQGEGIDQTDSKDPSGDCADFHQMVASMGTHPFLMRKLGLVLDVEIPVEKLGLEAPDHDLRIRAVPVETGIDEATHLCQWTAVEYDTTLTDSFRVFSVAAQEGPLQGGLQMLGSEQINIAQENIEHAVFALIQHKQDALGEQGKGPFPSLLQAGMRLTHAGAVTALEKAIAAQSELEVALKNRRRMEGSGVLESRTGEEPLRAHQLVRGYRVDVRDVKDGRWRSLCRRQIRYRSGTWLWPAEDTALEDEGVIEPAVYEDRHAEDKTLRATHDLFEWDGWSLVVARPDDSETGNEPRPDDCDPPLSAQFKVPAGSLQPQRFGHCYQFRLRAVDLAGNSLSAEEADEIGPSQEVDDFVTPPVCYLRVESAKPPVIFRAQPRGPGEAGDIIVLRDAELPKYRTDRFRVHILPPEVPLRIAEKHGLFDGMRAENSWRLIRDHRGELSFESGKPIEAADSPEKSRAIKEPAMVKEIYTPYLPDPMVKRSVLLLPGGGGSVEMPSFNDLPRRMQGRELARSFSLVVRPAKGEIRASVTDRVVTVEVPKGRVQEIQIAARLLPDDLAISAVTHPDWHKHPEHRKTHAAVTEALELKTTRGPAPEVLAPSRTIRIVYATQRPLISPEFVRPLIMPRLKHSTSAMLADDALEFDRPSTGRIDIYAYWEDPVDDPKETGWRITQNEMHAGGVRIDETDGKPLDPLVIDEPQRSPLAHDFVDTKHHEVTYQAVAVSRFVEFYPESLTEDADNITRSSRPVTLHVPSTVPPAPPDIAYVLPTLQRNDPAPDVHAAGAERRAEQIGEGLRVYLNRGWFSSGKGERLALVLAAQGTGDPPPQDVSAWGLNPVRNSAPLPAPLQKKHIWGGEKRITGWPVEDGAVDLVLYDVRFSNEHGLPFADIEFLSQRAFMPFVRLAFARYQEHAVANCELSRIVMADFVPLLPGRAVTVKRIGQATWSLTMRGYSYRHPDETTTIVQAHIEYMDAALPEDAVSWRPLGPAVTLTSSTEEPWRYQWTGQIRLIDQKVQSQHYRRRLVIQEFEPFSSVDSDSVPLADRSRLISAHAVPI